MEYRKSIYKNGMKIDKDEVSNYLKKYNNHMSHCFDLIYNEVYENFKDNHNDIDHDLHDKILNETISTLFFQKNYIKNIALLYTIK